MNQKTIYGVFSTLLLMAVMFFTACTDELVTNNETQKPETNVDGLVCFSAEIPEGTRTSIDKGGKFRWTDKDSIWVYDDANKWQVSQKIVLSADGTSAKFYLPGEYGAKSKYPVRFSNTSEDSISITSIQIQSFPNNSEHLGTAGDCGTATATLDKGGYSFKLNHKLAYIMFEPRIETETDEEVTLRRIKITEISEPAKDICGTIAFIGDGLDTKVVRGSNEITLICGEDVLPVEDGEKLIEEAQNYGFLIKNKGYTVYDDGDFYPAPDNTKPLGRAYMVIKPGENYKLNIEYEVSSQTTNEQRTFHESVNGNPEQWVAVSRGYTNIQPKSIAGSITFVENIYYKIRHKLVEPVVSVPTENNYAFAGSTTDIDDKNSGYYMWGARYWFWDGATTYPTHNDESQSDEAPTDADSNGNGRWYDDNISEGSAVTGRMSGGATYSVIYEWANNKGIQWADRERHRQAQSSNGWSNVLTANQISYYVVYGDPYYDNTTPWILDDYNGGNNTICYGGVWLKKKEYILSDNPGITWPNDNDGSTWGNLCAPFPAKDIVGHLYGQGGYTQNTLLPNLEGKQFNLRYCAPPLNLRMPYTNAGNVSKKPSDDGKDMSHYFFVPCLGQFDYGHKGSEGTPTLTLVGSEGFYWTKTPLQYNGGSGNHYYGAINSDTGNPAGYDNAFYLNIHYKYIALSWEQQSVYLKTGMRVATNGYDTGKTGIFK